jgi:hypothetical protein
LQRAASEHISLDFQASVSRRGGARFVRRPLPDEIEAAVAAQETQAGTPRLFRPALGTWSVKELPRIFHCWGNVDIAHA